MADEEKDKLFSELNVILEEYKNEKEKTIESIPLLPEGKYTDNIDEESFKKGQLSVMVYLSDLLGISLTFYDLRKSFQETIKTLIMLKMEHQEMATLHLKV